MAELTAPHGSDIPAIRDWSSRLIRSWWSLFGLRAPWSGDVTQAIDTSLLHATGSQLGFININEQATHGHAALEQHLINHHASYGRQLGRLIDAVAVLADHLDPAELAPEEQTALDKLIKLRDHLDDARRRR